MSRENKQFKKGILAGIIGVLCVEVGIGLGVGRALEGSVLTDLGFVNKLSSLEYMIDKYYLEDVDKKKLEEGIYTGLVYGLGDPYSRYYTAEEYAEENSATQGEYVGIGILMQRNEEGGMQIVDCYEGGPGETAGLKKNDIISAVNGIDVTEKEVKDVADMIKGKSGEKVVLTIHRENAEEAMKITVPITDVELPSVFHEMLDGTTGYIRISEFKGVTCQQYQKAFSELKDSGMEKLVVDLRNNPGGLLNSVCDILNEILPEGLIVYTEDKYGNRSEETCDGKHPIDIPLTVLVNELSASASEIFAGAVQDYGVGTIVGTTTYGKGIVQSISALTDGSAVKLTVSNHFTPKGNSIHKVGIKPDVEIKLDANLLNKDEITHEEDNQLQAALEVLNE